MEKEKLFCVITVKEGVAYKCPNCKKNILDRVDGEYQAQKCYACCADLIQSDYIDGLHTIEDAISKGYNVFLGNEIPIVHTNDSFEFLLPKGDHFTLSELQRVVNGLVEIIESPKGGLIVINEEGKLDNNHYVNETLTVLFYPLQDYIAGDGIYLPPKSVYMIE